MVWDPPQPPVPPVVLSCQKDPCPPPPLQKKQQEGTPIGTPGGTGHGTFPTSLCGGGSPIHRLVPKRHTHRVPPPFRAVHWPRNVLWPLLFTLGPVHEPQPLSQRPGPPPPDNGRAPLDMPDSGVCTSHARMCALQPRRSHRGISTCRGYSPPPGDRGGGALHGSCKGGHLC